MTERKLDVYKTNPDIASQYETLTGLEPKLIATFVPSDAAEQKRAFLNGEIKNPNHTYNRLKEINFSEQQEALDLAGSDLLSNPRLDPKFRSAYEAFIEEYKKKTRLQELARDFKAADGAEREVIKEEFMRLNGELYGLPDETVYRSLLHEKLILIKNKEFSWDAEVLRNELFDLIGDSDAEQPIPRFTPSPETVEWMKDTVDTLYGSMLSHVPAEQTVFSVEEVSVIFSEILDKEFGEAAVDWRVDIEPAKAVTVKTTEKRIVIPDDRGELTRKKVENLIVHEIGVHVLRAIMGEETDLPLLRHGFSGYLDAEEGLGQVMEQARVGVFAEAGANHYITAGLAYHDQKDFREVFEIKWRLSVLKKLKEGEDITTEAIEKARGIVYDTTLRFFRGTDELPWFKDLSYYNGAASMWSHLEEIRGDDLQFMFVLLGKVDPSQIDHRRVQYETRTTTKEAI